MASNAALLRRKADLALADLATGGDLLPEQSNTFLRRMIDAPSLMRQARVVQMTADTMNINKIQFSKRIMRHGLETSPLTVALESTEEELGSPNSLASRLPRLFAESDKPLIAVVDSGPMYEPLARALRVKGIPVFPSADQAIRSLGRYLCHRSDV